MLIYFVLSFLVTIALFVQKNKKTIFTILSLILLCILAFRGDKIGIDLPGYIDLFKSNEYSRTFLEPAYVYYSKLIGSISKSVFFFIAITSLTSLLPLIYVIKKDSVNILYSLFYLVISTHYLFLFSGIRQSISISFLILSFYFLSHKKIKISFVWYVLAGLFHTASWIFIYVYIIHYMTLKKKSLYILLVVSTIASFIIDPYFFFKFVSNQGGEFANMSNQGGEMMEYYSSYSSYLTGKQLPILRLILYTLPYVFISFVILYHSGDLNKKKDIYIKIFIVGVIINNLVIGNPIGFRMMKASLLLAMLLVPTTFNVCKNKKALYVGYSSFLFLIYAYYIYSRAINHIENDIVPYQLNSVL